MSVISVILIAIAAMFGIVMMSMPLIWAVKGCDSWKSLPRDVYAPYEQRILGIRPGVYWYSIAAANFVADWLKPLWGQSGIDCILFLSLIVAACLLTTHLRWSGKLLEKGQSIDNRLLRFAKYTFGWCAGLLILILSSSLLSLISMIRR